MKNKYGIGVTYQAGDVIGKTLITKKEVFVYASPTDSPDNKPLYAVKAGYPVGVVWSFLNANGSTRNRLWWMFQNDPFSKNLYYYIPHDANAFDVKTLQQQMDASGIKSLETKATEALDANLTTEQKIVKYAKYIGGAVIAYLLLREIIRKKL